MASWNPTVQYDIPHPVALLIYLAAIATIAVTILYPIASALYRAAGSLVAMP